MSGISTPPDPSSQESAGADFASQHSSNFPAVLQHLGISLAVTTHQAGKLVLVRTHDDRINTHYRNFVRPMGLACAADGTVALGTRTAILRFRNVPGVGAQLETQPMPDAVYMPSRSFTTGAIDIHEMAYDDAGKLWFVNTLFSCLCQLDESSSFMPVWRPAFVSKYSAEDRCHLNGLAMRLGRPFVLTALGASDDVEGWRSNKRNGGVVIDFATNEIAAHGLSMPHSPRWHEGRFWLLESGRGAVLQLDLETGARTEVARLPGFLRGLDFFGNYAFVGLCQLRETNAFTDLPITDDGSERSCGVWVIDTRTGRTVSVLKFTGTVQEIFSIAVLPGIHYPELINDNEKVVASAFVLPHQAQRDLVPPRPRPSRPPQST